MNRKRATVCFDSMQMTLSVISDRGGFGCLDYSASNFYSGVSKNFFVAPSEIEGCLSDLLNRYASFSNKKLSRMTVVLPQHFYRLQPIAHSRNVQQKVTEKDISILRKTEATKIDGYVFLSQKEGGFCLDGQGDYSFDVVEREAFVCHSLAAGVYLNEKVHELFENISKNIRVDFDFLAPSSALVEKINRDGHSRGLLLYMQPLSSDLIYFEGPMAVSSLNISFGSFHFTNVIMQKFNVDMKVANDIISHVNMGLAAANNRYVIFTETGKKTFSVKETNDILIEVAAYLANETHSAQKGLVDDVDLPLYITGSELPLAQGFCELVSEKTGLKTYSLSPDFAQWNKPEDYLYYALFEKF